MVKKFHILQILQLEHIISFNRLNESRMHIPAVQRIEQLQYFACLLDTILSINTSPDVVSLRPRTANCADRDHLEVFSGLKFPVKILRYCKLGDGVNHFMINLLAFREINKQKTLNCEVIFIYKRMLIIWRYCSQPIYISFDLIYIIVLFLLRPETLRKEE